MKKFGRLFGAVLLGMTAMAAFHKLRGRRGLCHGALDSGRCRSFIDWRLDQLLSRLEATGDQRSRIHQLKDQLLARWLELKSQHRETRRELTDLWKSSSPDASRVHGIVDERVDALRQFLHFVADSALELHRTLTDRQREAVARRLECRAGGCGR